MHGRRVALTASLILSLFLAARADTQTPQSAPAAQTPAAPRRAAAVDRVFVSPQIESDGRVTFRLQAPNATTVTVGGDINGSLVPDPTRLLLNRRAASPQGGRGGGTPAVVMTKGDNGIWSGTTVRPVRPGAWRYTFNVDGVTVVDSRNVNVTTSQTQVQSLLVVPGDFSETRDVPHGAVSAVRYVAKTLDNARREMYVYTPPGYEKGAGRFTGALPDSWRRRHGRLVVHGRTGERHPGQPAGREEGRADDRRDAFRLDAVRRAGDDGRRDEGSVQRRSAEGHHPVRRSELSHHERRRQPCAVRPLDGRHPDAEHRAAQPRHVPLRGGHELGLDRPNRTASSSTRPKRTRSRSTTAR